MNQSNYGKHEGHLFKSSKCHKICKVEKCYADKISLPAYFVWSGSCSSSMQSARAAVARAGQCKFCAHLKTWPLPSSLSCLCATPMLSPLHVSAWRTAETNVKWGVNSIMFLSIAWISFRLCQISFKVLLGSLGQAVTKRWVYIPAYLQTKLRTVSLSLAKIRFGQLKNYLVQYLAKWYCISETKQISFPLWC